MAEQLNGMTLNGRNEQFTWVLESKVNGNYHAVIVNVEKILLYIIWNFNLKTSSEGGMRSDFYTPTLWHLMTTFLCGMKTSGLSILMRKSELLTD